jgi:hypothetical protein
MAAISWSAHSPNDAPADLRTSLGLLPSASLARALQARELARGKRHVLTRGQSPLACHANDTGKPSGGRHSAKLIDRARRHPHGDRIR